MKLNRNARIFWTSFFCTLCVIALLYGLAVVDYYSRKIGFGDGKTLIYQITGKNLDLSCKGLEIWYNIFRN